MPVITVTPVTSRMKFAISMAAKATVSSLVSISAVVVIGDSSRGMKIF